MNCWFCRPLDGSSKSKTLGPGPSKSKTLDPPHYSTFLLFLLFTIRETIRISCAFCERIPGFPSRAPDRLKRKFTKTCVNSCVCSFRTIVSRPTILVRKQAGVFQRVNPCQKNIKGQHFEGLNMFKPCWINRETRGPFFDTWMILKRIAMWSWDFI